MLTWLKQVIKKEYRLIRILKKSEKSEIKVMENKSNGLRVIVKEYEGNGQAYKRLLNIEQDNLPIIYEVVNEDNNTLVIEEFIDGLTVGEVLETGLYTDEGVEKIISSLCKALGVLHNNNIIHRDIKPENIMITRDGNVKLIDFNIARIKSSHNTEKEYCHSENNNKNENVNYGCERDTNILGTIGFAAPEQFGISETDERTDIYAIGILINIMLTGEHPSKKLCTGKWKKVVKKCTSINPDDRYKSVDEIMSYY